MGDDKALVKAEPPRIEVAKSFSDWAPGQFLIIDRRGRAMDPARRRWWLARSWAKVTLMIGVPATLIGIVLGPVVGLAYAGAVLGAGAVLYAMNRGRFRDARRAAALLAAGRYEEAHPALVELLPRIRSMPQRLTIVRQIGHIEIHMGRPTEGLARLEELVPFRAGGTDPNADLADLGRAEALILLGRFDEARKVRDAIPATSDSELITMSRRAVTLSLAFHAGALHELPDDLTLHAWARDLLTLSMMGSSLVLLAWAFHQRGDDDMARHLLSEAPPRMSRWPLERTAPRLHAWMVEKTKTWQIE